jgi:hypothetical protein
MSRPADLREVPDLPEEIRQAALDGDLVLFVGAKELMLAAFFSRNFKYPYRDNVELSRETKGATKW